MRLPHQGLYRSFATRLTDHNNPHSFSSRMRKKRMTPLVALLENLYAKHGHAIILDVGGRKTFWEPVMETLHKCGAKVTLLNLAKEIENGHDDSVFTHVTGNGCMMNEYCNEQFHLALSNSVIEHVGNWEKITAFASEVRRVATCIFVQTPYYWCPLEQHDIFPFFHWLPKPVQVSLYFNFSVGSRRRADSFDEAVRWAEEPFMLDKRMMRHLFPDCEILEEKFCLMTKSLTAVRHGDTK